MINCWIYHFILLYCLIDLIIFFPFIFQKHFYVWCQKQLDYNSSLPEKRDAHERTRASRWRAITYPRASAISYHHAHWNSKCLPPVLILSHRAITCDSFKFLAQKPKRSWVTIKKWPQILLFCKVFAPLYFLFITFDLICNMTMFLQNGFWILRDRTPCPRQGLYKKSECVPPVLIHRAIACESFEILASTV